MNIWIITIIFIFFYAIYQHFKNQLNFFKDKGIPYLPGWPVIGNMAVLFHRNKHFSELAKDIYNVDREAKYVGAFSFTQPVIVLRDLELIKTVTIKNFDNFPDHNSYIDESLDPLMARNLANLTGNRWKVSRGLLSPAFTGSKLKTMHGLIIDCAKNLINHLHNLSESDRKMIDTKDLFSKITNDAIATCAFGISVDTLKDPNNDFYVLGKEALNVEGFRFLKFFLARAAPRLLKLMRIRLISKRITEFFMNIIETTVKIRDKEGIKRPDMIQLMMNARDDNKFLKLDSLEMTAHAFIFFLAGFDTTANQMCIIAHELAINSEIQKKLQAEIDEVSKKNETPSYEDIQNMQYLDAIFNESMRRHTQVPFTDRICKKDFKLPPAVPGGKSYIIKSGMNIWIPTSAIHQDPKYYEDPEKFDPERYYDKKVTINDVLNLGFGIGPRGCIGNRFATLETKILFFYLLREFNLKPNSKTHAPFKYDKTSIPLKPEGGFWLDVEPRNLE